MLNKMKFAVAGAVVAAAMASTGAQAATANANARVEILTPVTIAKTSDLDFGLIATSGAGTVVVDEASAAKSCTGAVTCVGTTGVLGAFDVTAAAAQTITVSVGNTSLVGPAGSVAMPAALRISGTGVTVTGAGLNAGTFTSAAAAKSVKVGGTVTVGATQLAGVYTGAFTLTADYQ
jgi:Mat/Ecp fimbriae major subunit